MDVIKMKHKDRKTDLEKDWHQLEFEQERREKAKKSLEKLKTEEITKMKDAKKKKKEEKERLLHHNT
jgi:chromosome segregation ATPase